MTKSARNQVIKRYKSTDVCQTGTLVWSFIKKFLFMAPTRVKLYCDLWVNDKTYKSLLNWWIYNSSKETGGGAVKHRRSGQVSLGSTRMSPGSKTGLEQVSDFPETFWKPFDHDLVKKRWDSKKKFWTKESSSKGFFDQCLSEVMKTSSLFSDPV